MYQKISIIFLISVLLFPVDVNATPQHQSDTDSVDAKYIMQLDSIMQSEEEKQRQINIVQARYSELKTKEEMRMPLEGIGQLMSGGIHSITNRTFVNTASSFPARKDIAGNITAAVPLAVTYILKASGVKSRSKIQRMLTANAIGIGLTEALVQGLKYGTTEMRPDRSDTRSFPSHHSAIAFAGATILSREYGYISPWITVGAYTTATLTMFSRMNTSKHWFNDLMIGAGIGIVSANFGYFIADKIFKEDGINDFELRKKDVNRMLKMMHSPSGIDIISGTEMCDHTLTMDDGSEIKLSTGGLSTTVRGNAFLNPYFAISASATFSQAQAKVYSCNESVYTGDIITFGHVNAFATFSMPVKQSIRSEIRMGFGVRHNTGVTFTPDQQLSPQADSDLSALQSYSIAKHTSMELSFGTTFCMLSGKNYASGVSFDYHYAFTGHFRNRITVGTLWRIFF